MNAVPEPRPPALRPMTVRDLDAVAAVEAQAYGFPWSRGNFVDSLAAGYWATLLEVDDALVGYTIALPGAGELHLLNVTVAPPWQGQGHG
jgi:ribosomal-protein-alanine N-acetyltransferase